MKTKFIISFIVWLLSALITIWAIIMYNYTYMALGSIGIIAGYIGLSKNKNFRKL